MLASDLEDLQPTLPRQCHSRRVVEARDRVEKLDGAPLRTQRRDVLPKRLGNEAVLIHRHVIDVSLIGAEDHHGRHVAGSFGQHDVTWIEEKLANQLECVLRAGRHHDVVGIGANPLKRHDVEDLLTQSRKSLTRTVLQCYRSLGAHDFVDGALHEILRKSRHVRHAPRE